MPPPSDSDPRITLHIQDKIALIRINVPNKLGALTQDLYGQLASHLRTSASNPITTTTILTGTGRYFSAGADFTVHRTLTDPDSSDTESVRRTTGLRNFVSNNLDLSHAFYAHPKILITALNGPVIGLSAALIAHSDFIYCTPSTFLLTPFSSLGLVTEGVSSRAFVHRLGISKANEALIMSKRIGAEDLLRTGFVNKIFHVGGTTTAAGKHDNANDEKKSSDAFLTEVLKEVHDRLGDHLNSESLLKVKALIRRPERQTMDAQNVAEVMTGLERLVAGVPQEEFRKIASGEKRHKL